MVCRLLIMFLSASLLLVAMGCSSHSKNAGQPESFNDVLDKVASVKDATQRQQIEEALGKPIYQSEGNLFKAAVYPLGDFSQQSGGADCYGYDAGTGGGGSDVLTYAAAFVVVTVLWNVGCLGYNLADNQTHSESYSLLVYYGSAGRVVAYQRLTDQAFAEIDFSRLENAIFERALIAFSANDYFISETEKITFWAWLCDEAISDRQQAAKALIFYSAGGYNFTRISNIHALAWAQKAGYETESIRGRMTQSEIDDALTLANSISQKDCVSAYGPPPDTQTATPYSEAYPKLSPARRVTSAN